MKLFLLIFLLWTIIPAQLDSFKPGKAWYDTEGNIINAHSGGMVIHEGTYYWIGERRFSQSPTSRGVNVYSSTDLYNWKYEGLALDNSNDTTSEIRLGCIMERPKVIYNDKTGKFVMWFHLELAGQGYAAARTAVAVSDKLIGPYTYLRSTRPHAGILPANIATTDTTGEDWKFFRRDFDGGQMARDMTLFKDEDGRAYHVFSSEENRTLHMALLSDDYLSHSGRYIRIKPGGNNEAPAFFKHKGKYYLMASDCTGWKPNPARSYRADSMMGEWRSLGNPCVGTNDQVSTTFRSQSTFIVPVQDRRDAFIFMGDRWNPGDQLNSRYVWLPVILKTNRFELKWHSEWDLDVFGPVSNKASRYMAGKNKKIMQNYSGKLSRILKTFRNDLPSGTSVTLSIITLKGREVQKITIDSDSMGLFDISLTLASGVYLVQLEAGLKSASYRLLLS